MTEKEGYSMTNEATNRNIRTERQDFRIGDIVVILGEERQLSAFEPAAEILEVDRRHRLLRVRLISAYEDAGERDISFSDAIDASHRQDRYRYEPGQTVRICSGPFADSNARIESVDHRRRKLLLMMAHSGQSAQQIEIDAGQVEPA